VLFVDRDGVINKKPADHDYVKSWKEFTVADGIVEYLKEYYLNGFKIIIITNQRGIARGIVSESTFLDISNKMVRSFEEAGVPISAIYYCPHSNKATCDCRKPKPGLISQATKDFNINLKESALLGDSQSDIEAGKAAKVGKLILISSDTQNILNTY